MSDYNRGEMVRMYTVQDLRKGPVVFANMSSFPCFSWVERLKVYQTQPNYIFFSFSQCSRYTNYPRYTSQNLPTNRQIHGYSGTRMIQSSMIVTSGELARVAIKGNRARYLHLHDMCVYLPLWSVGLTPRSTIVVSSFGAIGP